MKIKISKKYYNGKISNNAPIYRAILFDFENNTLTLESEQYGDITTKNYGKTENKEILDLSKFLNEEQKTVVANFAKSIQDSYKEEYFENRVPNTLSYVKVEVDEAIYKFGNIKCKEEYYKDVVSKLSAIVSQIESPENIIKLILDF